jgi:DNA-binding NtrC family response regulator
MAIQLARPSRPIDLYVNCVILSSSRSEYTFLRNVFRLAGLRFHHAESLEQADVLLTTTGSTVLLADVLFENGSWRGAPGMLSKRHPFVPMLVIADPADCPFLKDLFDRGACGVVWKPFEFEIIRRQIRTLHEARRAWQEEISAGAPFRWAGSPK